MKGLRIKEKNNYTAILLGIGSIAAFIIFLSFSDVAIEYMKKGLGLCAKSVIPSLFPFMIISELMVKSPLTYRIGGLLKHPMRWLFGISEAGGCALILGMLCGFPIGAKTAASMYDAGTISKDEFERLLCFCNNPGSAFVISAVGISLFGNKQVGILLYVCVILSSLTMGIFLNIFSDKKKSTHFMRTYNSIKGCDAVTVFTSSVASSAISMLTVCAYVVFFSAFNGCIATFLTNLHLPDSLSTLIFGFFEITSGVSNAVLNHGRQAALILCALFTAWSGLSVHCQIITICSGRDLSFKKYFISKATQGLICATFMGISLKFLFPGLLPSAEQVFMVDNASFQFVSPIFSCVSFFLASVSVPMICLKSNIRKTFFSVDKKA